MKIFLSYASEQSELAKEIALALRAENHAVFFDRSSLPPANLTTRTFARRSKIVNSSFSSLALTLSPRAVIP